MSKENVVVKKRFVISRGMLGKGLSLRAESRKITKYAML
jgi:hypothetical protein